MRDADGSSVGRLVAPFAVAGLAFALYWWTLAPSVAPLRDTVDSGELVAVAQVMGVAHPPGSAIWLPLGRLALEALPFHEPAYRTNLLSAALMAAAAGLVVVAARRWVPGTPAWSTATGGFLFALAPLPWSQALVTEVLALQAFLSALALVLAPSAAQGRRWPLFGFVLGLLAWNHPTGLAVALPLGLACAARGRPRGRTAWAAAAGFALPGAYTLAYLLIRADAPIAWGDTSTLAGTWDHVSGRIYRDVIEWSPGGVLGDLPETLRRALRQSPPPIWVLLPAGALAVARARPVLSGALGASTAAVVLFVSAYRAAGREDYLTEIAMVLALLAAWGLAEAWRWLRPRLPDRGTVQPLAVGAAGLLAAWAAISGTEVSLRGDRALVDEALATLEAAPPGATLTPGRDEETFPLWYASVVLEERPDVTIADARGIAPPVGGDP